MSSAQQEVEQGHWVGDVDLGVTIRVQRGDATGRVIDRLTKFPAGSPGVPRVRDLASARVV